jgi:hypothetical protein
MDTRKKIIENILIVPNPTNKRISKMKSTKKKMLQYIPLNQISPYPSSGTRHSSMAGECVDLAPELTRAFYFKY